jgi:two-component system chemotaxis response regulator CheY
MTYTPAHHFDVAVIAGADVELLDVIKTVLIEDAHLHVITAAAPELVLPLIETTAPGVVILDLNLPEQSGWNILAALRQHPRFGTLPVLLLTTAPEDEPRVAALNAPWINLMFKPFDLEAVLQRMQRMMQQQSHNTREAQQREAGAARGAALPVVSCLPLSDNTGK